MFLRPVVAPRPGRHGRPDRAALPTAATAGAPALESYPVDTTVPSHTGNLFPGIAAAFARHGFEVVARRKPDRPVMRKLLGDVRNFST